MEEKNKCSYQEQLQTNSQIAIIPKGNSMWPTLKNQGQSVIIGAKTERLNELDVALYVRGKNDFVLHRVIKVLPDGYLMCGDSQFVLEKVSEEQIFGVVVYKSAILSLVYRIVGTKVGFFLFIIIPILFIIASEMIATLLEKEEERRNQLKEKNKKE